MAEETPNLDWTIRMLLRWCRRPDTCPPCPVNLEMARRGMDRKPCPVVGLLVPAMEDGAAEGTGAGEG